MLCQKPLKLKDMTAEDTLNGRITLGTPEKVTHTEGPVWKT